MRTEKNNVPKQALMHQKIKVKNKRFTIPHYQATIKNRLSIEAQTPGNVTSTALAQLPGTVSSAGDRWAQDSRLRAPIAHDDQLE